ncbi:hypothetical protein pb186bvf_000845 [Paramecium bursaria]
MGLKVYFNQLSHGLQLMNFQDDNTMLTIAKKKIFKLAQMVKNLLLYSENNEDIPFQLGLDIRFQNQNIFSLCYLSQYFSSIIFIEINEILNVYQNNQFIDSQILLMNN